MRKLNELKQRCKGGVSIFFDDHKVNYMSISDHCEDDRLDINNDVLNKMIELDSIISIHFYPDTPIGSYSVHHYDIELAVDECLRILNDA